MAELDGVEQAVLVTLSRLQHFFLRGQTLKEDDYDNKEDKEEEGDQQQEEEGGDGVEWRGQQSERWSREVILSPTRSGLA